MYEVKNTKCLNFCVFANVTKESVGKRHVLIHFDFIAQVNDFWFMPIFVGFLRITH